MADTLIKSLCKKSSKRKVSSPRTIRLRHRGQIYNLKDIFDEVCKHYFPEVNDLHITWSSSSIRGARRCRRLGCFVPSKKLIRISQILDDTEIPYYFISFIVYHEILHYLFPPIKRRGRREIHHAKFKAQEKKFKDFDLVRAWEKETGKKKFFLE